MISYLQENRGIFEWLTTKDHKKIAWLYLIAITSFFFLGALAAFLMRLELYDPSTDLLGPEIYNRMFSLHGIIMVWFFLVPSIPTVLGNFMLPLMLGADDVAYPKLNLASWYIFVVGGLFTLYAIIDGGVDTGWTFYTPYSTLFSNSHVVLAATGVFVTGFSSIATGVNFIATVHKKKRKDMKWLKMPLFVWSIYSTSAIMVLATPVLASALVLISLERLFGVGIFDPSMGGDPLLFQHIFWFYSHPAVYIMVLPAMGVISEIVACFSRKRIFGYVFIAFSSLAIAILGFLVWGHHMFVSGQSAYANIVFSFLSMLVAVPSAIKVFNWTATLYKGRIYLRTPMLYAMTFIWLFVVGGMTGIFLASISIDTHVHDTYFVIAHFHYIMVGGAVTAYLGGVHFWFPKMTGKTFNETFGKISAFLIFCGFNMSFFPQFLLGYMGMPRRYQTYPQEFEFLNQVSTWGLVFLAGGYLFPVLYLAHAAFRRKRAVENPWNSPALEWATPSPPPTKNFIVQPAEAPDPYAYDESRQFIPAPEVV